MTDSNFQIVSTSDDRFETDVVVRSQLGLVIVDFWAEWCAPCRMLAPVLEKLAEEFQDRLTLVKVDTEKNPLAAQRFQVAGIPAVFAVLDGKTIDGFQGVLPEPALRDWLQKCLSSERMLRIQQEVTTDPKSAESALREMIAKDDPADQAKVLLLQALHEQDKVKECRELISDLESRGFLEPEVERIQSELALHEESDVDVTELRRQVEQNTEDLSLQLQLAKALAANKEYSSAFEICLRLVSADRAGTGEQARLLMLDVFRVEGDDSEITREFRRKLSMALY